MKILFRKISATPSSVSIKNGEITAEGLFKALNHHLVSVEWRIEGDMEVICDRCGEAFDLHVNEPVSLRVSDGCSEEEALDIIESHDGSVDFDALLESEVEAIRSGYHYCASCKEKNR
ncbi:MAG: hypothetical protein B6D59_03655 [Campylobacteraceae bacterium 4484_4]|nr:MAG: hypothetical protein B6D59_03655 [Campylobacteraceae bacterium 4484_4]